MEDYQIIIKLINKFNYKWIIVPHEINKNDIKFLKEKIKKKIVFWSKLNDIENCDVLIIDKVGILQDIYYYADIVYIGGGFSKGVHNCLEAAIFSKPLIFGPNYNSFTEALFFVKNKIAFTVNDKESFEKIINKNFDLNHINKHSKSFFKNNKDAIKKIIEKV